MVEMGNQSVVVHQGGHELEGLAFKRDWDDFSSWGCIYCCMGHWVVVCFDQQNLPDQKNLSYCWNGRTLLSHMTNEA